MRTDILLAIVLVFAYVLLGVGVQRLAKGFSQQIAEGPVGLFAWPIALVVVALTGDAARD
jgi:hypothetical protein